MSEHGTPTGYDAGCHGAAECTNHKTGLMTCTEAHIRYQGDYQYRKAVDAGTATDEREQFVKEKRPSKRVVVETKAEAAKRPARVPKVRLPKPKSEYKKRVPRFTHGTPYGARQCEAPCPNELAGGVSCGQAKRNYVNAHTAARRAGLGNTPTKHGTLYGYKDGCRNDCPSTTGTTCMDASRAYYQAYRAKARAAA